VATALIEGRTIIIEGGNYVLKNQVFECVDCGEVWEVEPCSVGGSKVYVFVDAHSPRRNFLWK
jgi:uncharacterized protein